MVVCDVVDTEGDPVEVSPRRILGRQVERAPSSGSTSGAPPSSSSTCSARPSRRPPAKGWRDLDPHVVDHRGLPAPPDVTRGVHPPADPQRDGGGRHPRRVLEGRGRPRPARDQRDLRAGPGGGRPTSRLQERGQGDRRQCGRSASFMAKWSMDEAGSSCHIHASLWDADRRRAAHVGGRRRAPRTLSEVGRQFLAGQLLGAGQLTWCWRPTSTPTSATSRTRGHPPRWCGATTTAPVASALVGHGERPPGRDAGSPGPTSTRTWPWPRLIAAGLWGIEQARARRALRGQRLQRRRRAAGADDAGRGHRRARGVARWPPMHSARTSTTTCSTRPDRSGPVQPGGHRLGAAPELRAHLSQPAVAVRYGPGSEDGCEPRPHPGTPPPLGRLRIPAPVVRSRPRASPIRPTADGWSGPPPGTRLLPRCRGRARRPAGTRAVQPCWWPTTATVWSMVSCSSPPSEAEPPLPRKVHPLPQSRPLALPPPGRGGAGTSRPGRRLPPTTMRRRSAQPTTCWPTGGSWPSSPKESATTAPRCSPYAPARPASPWLQPTTVSTTWTPGGAGLRQQAALPVHGPWSESASRSRSPVGTSEPPAIPVRPSVPSPTSWPSGCVGPVPNSPNGRTAVS